MASPIGERIKELRLQRRLTQGDLAVRIGVSRQTISNWEVARHEVSTADLGAIAKALGVRERDLIDATERAGRTQPEIPQTGDQRREVDPLFNASAHNHPPPGVRPLPVYHWGSVGDPRDPARSPHPAREEYPPAGREYLIGANGFALDIRGNTMVGANLRDSDVCWVNPDRPYRNGELVLALVTDSVGDDGLVVKTYVCSEGVEYLQSETIEGPSPLVCRSFTIIGPVVGIQRWVLPPG